MKALVLIGALALGLGGCAQLQQAAQSATGQLVITNARTALQQTACLLQQTEKTTTLRYAISAEACTFLGGQPR